MELINYRINNDFYRIYNEFSVNNMRQNSYMWNTDDDSGDHGGAQTVERAIAALRLVAASGTSGTSIGVTKVAASLGLAKPTAHRLLRTLARTGMLAYDIRTRGYHVGPLAFEIGLIAAQRYNLRDIGRPILEELAQETGDTSFLFVRSGNDAVCIDRVQGSYPIQTPVLPIGSRQPLGVSAGGLALLMAMADDEARHVVAANAARLGAYGDLSVDELNCLLSNAREAGYAYTANHAVPEVGAVGCPIPGRMEKAIAAITVATTQQRLTTERAREIVPAIRRAAIRLAGLFTAPNG